MQLTTSGRDLDDHNFAPGDNVEVTEGELINLQGKVTRIDGNRVTILPRHEDLKDEIEFMSNELKKYFHQGDHVKVIGESSCWEGCENLLSRQPFDY